ncbi:MAG: ATP-binding protein [Eggerthellaceae bacterium]|nr:ATP-binding protein [Eggerthellaceae bacterium]
MVYYADSRAQGLVMEDKTAKAIVFRLDRIPDLSLTKYSAFGGSSSDEILEKHLGFLRQFSRKPRTGIHLLYAYNPDGPDGARLHIYFIVDDTGSFEGSSLGNARELVESSPIAPFFGELNMIRWKDGVGFVPSKRGEGDAAAFPMSRITELVASKQEAGESSQRLSVCSALVKSTKFIVPTPPHPEAKNGYYVQPEFTENEESRLFSMMKLMEALNEPVAYRVDLYPSSHSDDLRSDLPLNIIKSKRDSGGIGRNYELEGIEKSYEKLLEKLDGSPLFNANIFVFSNSAETGRALLEAAASEAVKKGSCDIAHFRGAFTPTSFLTEERWSARMRDTGGRFVATQHQDPVSHPGYYIVDEKAMNFRHSYITTQFTLEEAGAFFRLPVLEDGEFVQRQKETAPEVYDPNKGRDKALYLGVDDNNQSVYFKEALLKKHAFISGVPGSGKTVAMCHLVTSLLRDGIPFMVLEPAKSEYRAILNNRGYVGNVHLFAPGGNTPFPLRINPFEMPVGVSVGHHINRLCQVFEGAFPLEGALPFLLERAIESVYLQMGWHYKMIRSGDEALEFPTLSMLYEQIQKELDKESYDGEVGGNLKSAIHMRIGGLLRRELGDIFDVPISTVEPSDWLNMSSIVELEALGASQSNFLTLLLCVLIRESLMAKPQYTDDVRHVMFIEEAHNLIGPEASVVTGENADPKLAATAFISDMLREVRALGEGMVIADQLPTAIAPEVLKNTGLKIALRITSADDRELLGSMMMASPAQLEGMAVANPGRALVMYEGLQRPFAVQMTEWLNDIKVEGYIDDKEMRKKASTPQRDDELRSWVRSALQQHADGGWYQKVGYLTAWIDLCAVKLRVDDLCNRMTSIIDSCQALQNDKHEDASAINAGDSAFMEGYIKLGIQQTSPADILRDNGFTSRYEMDAEYRAIRHALDFKTLNWSTVLPEFQDGVPTGGNMMRYYRRQRQIAPDGPAKQIAWLYLQSWQDLSLAKLRTEQVLGDGESAETLEASIAKLDENLSILNESGEPHWTKRDWLNLRSF